MKLIIGDKEYHCELMHFSIGDCIENEEIMYSESSNKIIVMNITATCIYRRLQELWQRNSDISDIEISDYILDVFEIDEFQKKDVLVDVRDVLKVFIAEGVLMVCNDLLNENNL